MATLAQGQAIKLHLSASQTITVTPASNGRATVSANGPGNLSYPQKTIYAAETFGPYVADTVMSIAAVSGSLEYTDPYTLVPSYSLDASNNVTGLVGPDGAVLLPSRIVGDGVVNPSFGVMESQPIGITRPVREGMKMVCGFGDGLWTSSSEGVNHTSTQGYTGFDAAGDVDGIRSRTGQAEMLKVVCNNNTSTNITLGTPATNILTPDLGGKIMLAVYLETQPGYEAGGTAAGSIAFEMSTAVGGSFTNACYASFNQHQLREGWNFIKFVMRNPLAYLSGTPPTEYHPFGVAARGWGTGADSNIVDSPITSIRLVTQNLNGATLYFDSVWTGWETQAQVVLGTDAAGTDWETLALPKFQQYGWVGYVAVPMRVYSSGSKLITDWSSANARLQDMYRAGWECLNHTANHLAMGALTVAAEIDYEIAAVQALYANGGMRRGNEFYASPQSSSSRLAENVIRNRGIKLQRHARKQNVSVTPWGVDNLHHIGAIDMGHSTATGVATASGGAAPSTVAGWQTLTKLKRYIDVLEAYGDTGFPFWHAITTLGDSGSGEDLTGDDLMLTKSAFDGFIDYIAAREAAGGIRVRDGITGFYYGVGR